MIWRDLHFASHLRTERLGRVHARQRSLHPLRVARADPAAHPLPPLHRDGECRARWKRDARPRAREHRELARDRSARYERGKSRADRPPGGVDSTAWDFAADSHSHPRHRHDRRSRSGTAGVTIRWRGSSCSPWSCSLERSCTSLFATRAARFRAWQRLLCLCRARICWPWSRIATQTARSPATSFSASARISAVRRFRPPSRPRLNNHVASEAPYLWRRR